MAYNQTTYPRETNIRTIHIRGIAVSISDQRGALLIIGKPEYKGKVALNGSPLQSSQITMELAGLDIVMVKAVELLTVSKSVFSRI